MINTYIVLLVIWPDETRQSLQRRLHFSHNSRCKQVFCLRRIHQVKVQLLKLSSPKGKCASEPTLVQASSYEYEFASAFLVCQGGSKGDAEFCIA